MKHYSGWYFCTKSNWGGDIFDARNLVSIDHDTEDFNNLIEKKSLYPDDEFNSWRCYYQLKPEVIKWLEENVKDENAKLKGWCCGDKEYNSSMHCEDFSVFFYRRRDALNFIKTWSIHKKPTETYNQNTYVKKVLDKKTNTLKVVKR